MNVRYDLRYLHGVRGPLAVYDRQHGRVVYRVDEGDARFARELVRNLNQDKTTYQQEA